jgi:hypothetical protein
MVVAAKWTGTNADRHDMEKLQLDQVLRVREPKTSLQPTGFQLQEPWLTLVCASEKFWPPSHVWFRFYLDLRMGVYTWVSNPIRSSSYIFLFRLRPIPNHQFFAVAYR